MRVYLDLDDTLADTSKEIENIFSYKNYEINHSSLKKNIKLIKDLWLWQIIKKNPDFWENIGLRHNANEIYQEALKISGSHNNIYILTALPKFIYRKESLSFEIAASNKKKWVEKNFKDILKENIIVVHAKDKDKYAMNGIDKSVLFDDSIKNVKKWKNAGGIAYLVKKNYFEKF